MQPSNVTPCRMSPCSADGGCHCQYRAFKYRASLGVIAPEATHGMSTSGDWFG